MEKKQHSSIPFLILLLFSLFLLLWLFWSYMSAIVLALLITGVSYPLYLKIKELFKGKETAASLFMTVIILLILIIPVGWFVGTLSKQAFEFYHHTRSAVSIQKIQEAIRSDSVWAQHVRQWGEMTGVEFTPEKIEELAVSLGKTVGLFLYKQTSSVASNLFNFLIQFFIMTLTIYYLFRDGERLKNYLIELIPLPNTQLQEIVDKFQEMGRIIIVFNGVSGIIQGVLGGFGFFIFGLSSAFLWGTVISIMAFLPIIGASIVFLPATAILFLQGDVKVGIGFLIYNVFYSSILEYLIKPRLIGQGMKMNSLLVFIGIIGGIRLFGILGIVYGPLIITIFITLAEIYKLEYKEQVA